MRLRDAIFRLSSDERVPLFRRVAQAVQDAILQGRLQPGHGLPGTRALAEQFAVNRSTVIQALQELEAEGWIVTEPSRGSFVAPSIPELKGFFRPSSGPPALEKPQEIPPGFDLPSRLRPLTRADGEAIDLSEGLPDSRLAPMDALGRATQRALLRHGEELLQISDPLGNMLLRRELVAWLAERRGLTVSPEQILITRGNRATLSLLATALLGPGESVAVENPGQCSAWEAFQHHAGAELIPVPVDPEGLDVDALEAALRQGRCRAVYVTPQRQYPTTVTLSVARRARLLELAVSHRVPVIEDDHDSDYAFGEQPHLALASQDDHGVVLYTTSLGRLLAPELRLNCVVGPATVIDRLARVQRNHEWQGDRVTEWAVADLMRDGDLARHLRRARKIYHERMRHLADRLRTELGTALDVVVPGGGLALWVRVKAPLDAGAFVDAARIRGVILRRPEHYGLHQTGDCLRIGFAQADEGVLDHAVSRLVQGAQDLCGG